MNQILSVIFLFTSGLLIAQKPILPDFHADPSIHYWDGKYWLYPSTDEPGSISWNEMCRWYCYSSVDLVNWENEGEIFSLKDISWAEHSAFAPDAMKWKEKYYFFFPAQYSIGVAISDKASGPFQDALGKPLITSKDATPSAFDPCIFINDDDTPYLYYGGWGNCAVAKLKDNLVEVDGKILDLPLKNYDEGIWVHKKDSIYYFTYPMGYKKEGKYKQLLVYSTSKSPTGPFEYKGAFFDNNSRNSHHSIIEIKGQWYLFYHIQGPSPYERRVCVEYLYYNNDGSIMEVKMTKEGIEGL